MVSNNAKYLTESAYYSSSVRRRRGSAPELIVLKIIDELSRIRSQLNGLQTGIDDVAGEREYEQRRGEDLKAELDAIRRERSLLTKEIAELQIKARTEKEHAERVLTTAEELLDKYQKGLPRFLETSEKGAHFPTFGGFYLEARSKVPTEADTLDMMLRLFAYANGRNERAFEVLWAVHEIGKGLYATMQAMGCDDKWQFEEATAWSYALNKEGLGKYTVFVPIVRSNFNGVEMTGGTPQSLIQQVKSWGVKNRRGDVERKAIVK